LSTSNDLVTTDARPVRFVIDRSFLHDAFRIDYPVNESAKWLFPYFVHRSALAKVKVCIMPSTAVERWSREFRPYLGQTPRAVLAVQAIAEVYQLADPRIRLDDSTLIVAKILNDSGITPVILSSVKADKWSERTQELGIKLGLEEFTEDMSKKRIQEKMWCAPMSAKSSVSLMKFMDTKFFSQIVKVLGYPKGN
jgi:hypothetical protein